MSALAAVRPVARRDVDLAALAVPAARAVELGEVVLVDGLAVVPDVLVVEAWAQGHRLPSTVRLTWPVAGDEHDGRSVALYRR